MDKPKQNEFASRDYPVQENMTAQRKEWRFQAAGNYVLFTIVILALLGLFSDGIISETAQTSANGKLTVEYQRLIRAQSDERYILRVQGEPDRPVRITLGGDFMERFQIQTLFPEPLITHTSAREMTLTFAATPDGRHAVWIGAQPESAGYFTSMITVDGQPGMTLRQWSWP